MLYFRRMRIVVFLSILLEVHLQQKENKIPQQANTFAQRADSDKQVVWYLVYLYCLRTVRLAGL